MTSFSGTEGLISFIPLNLSLLSLCSPVFFNTSLRFLYESADVAYPFQRSFCPYDSLYANCHTLHKCAEGWVDCLTPTFIHGPLSIFSTLLFIKSIGCWKQNYWHCTAYENPYLYTLRCWVLRFPVKVTHEQYPYPVWYMVSLYCKMN